MMAPNRRYELSTEFRTPSVGLAGQLGHLAAVPAVLHVQLVQSVLLRQQVQRCVVGVRKVNPGDAGKRFRHG